MVWSRESLQTEYGTKHTMPIRCETACIVFAESALQQALFHRERGRLLVRLDYVGSA